jgi:hypothetical protein
VSGLIEPESAEQVTEAVVVLSRVTARGAGFLDTGAVISTFPALSSAAVPPPRRLMLYADERIAPRRRMSPAAIFARRSQQVNGYFVVRDLLVPSS